MGVNAHVQALLFFFEPARSHHNIRPNSVHKLLLVRLGDCYNPFLFPSFEVMTDIDEISGTNEKNLFVRQVYQLDVFRHLCLNFVVVEVGVEFLLHLSICRCFQVGFPCHSWVSKLIYINIAICLWMLFGENSQVHFVRWSLRFDSNAKLKYVWKL